MRAAPRPPWRVLRLTHFRRVRDYLMTLIEACGPECKSRQCIRRYGLGGLAAEPGSVLQPPSVIWLRLVHLAPPRSITWCSAYPWAHCVGPQAKLNVTGADLPPANFPLLGNTSAVHSWEVPSHSASGTNTYQKIHRLGRSVRQPGRVVGEHLGLP